MILSPDEFELLSRERLDGAVCYILERFSRSCEREPQHAPEYCDGAACAFAALELFCDYSSPARDILCRFTEAANFATGYRWQVREMEREAAFDREARAQHAEWLSRNPPHSDDCRCDTCYPRTGADGDVDGD